MTVPGLIHPVQHLHIPAPFIAGTCSDGAPTRGPVFLPSNTVRAPRIIHSERETFDGEQHNRPRLKRVRSSATPHDDTSPALTPVMRPSITTARQRQHERLTSLVQRVALTCTDHEAAELNRLITLVHAGALPAREAHQRILEHQRATATIAQAA